MDLDVAGRGADPAAPTPEGQNEIQFEWTWHGAAAPEVVAVGNSHRGALAKAITLGLTPVRAAMLVNTPHPDERYWQIIDSVDPSVPIAFLFQGNETNIRFLFDCPTPFGVSHQDHFSGRGQAVSVEMVRALHLDSAQALGALLDRYEGRPRLLVEPPPPTTAADVKAYLRDSEPLMGLIATLGTTIEEVVVTPLELRIALNAIVRELHAEIAAQRGVGVLSPPIETVAPDGSLKSEYVFDTMHANAAYGALVWRDIAAQFGLNPDQQVRA